MLTAPRAGSPELVATCSVLDLAAVIAMCLIVGNELTLFFGSL